MNRALDIASSWTGSVLAGTAGLVTGPLGPRPEQPLELYDFEGCPFCRKVRQALSMLDLEARIYPCPHGGTRYRPEVKRRGGRAQFPYLVDPNTGREMYESNDITRYLYETYGNGRRPLSLSLGPLTTAASSLASLSRLGGGSRARPNRQVKQPLELWSFEASPYCRIAREALSELEIPYLLHNVAKKSPSRKAFIERSGKMMVPYLADPNTGREMFESADIVRYLRDAYGA